MINGSWVEDQSETVSTHNYDITEAASRRLNEHQLNADLFNLIHRSKNLLLKPDSASVQIEFEHAYLGTTDVYQVSRNWTKNGSGVKEKLAIQKNTSDSNIRSNEDNNKIRHIHRSDEDTSNRSMVSRRISRSGA